MRVNKYCLTKLSNLVQLAFFITPRLPLDTLLRVICIIVPRARRVHGFVPSSLSRILQMVWTRTVVSSFFSPQTLGPRHYHVSRRVSAYQRSAGVTRLFFACAPNTNLRSNSNKSFDGYHLQNSWWTDRISEPLKGLRSDDGQGISQLSTW